MNDDLTKIKLLKEDKNKYKLLITNEREKLNLKAMQYKDNMVQGGKKGKSTEDIICVICDYEEILNNIQNEIDILEDHWNKVRDILKENDEEYSKIIELKGKNYKIYAIAEELHVSDRTINRRLKRLREKVK